jgi:ADP-ribosylglycohydrolase
MMRISPLGVFGANYELSEVARWAREDASLTHPNPLCHDANALFTMAIAFAVKTETKVSELYRKIREWAVDLGVESALLDTIDRALDSPPSDYVHQQGWVLIAFQNALYQLLHAKSLEEGVVDTIMAGGDTDTNAAICGALLGAVYGCEAIPAQWLHSLLNCRPEAGNPRVHHPRPECFWPVDVLELASGLIEQ